MTGPCDNFNRPAGALGNPTSGPPPWVLRETGPYDNNGNPIAQVPSIITLNGLGQAVPDPVQMVNHLQFATLDFGTGDVDFDTEWRGTPSFATGMGAVFRWTAPDQYWNAFYYNAIIGVPQIFLERQNGPTFGAASPRINVAAPASGVTNIMRIRAIGSAIEVYFNEVLCIAISNSSFAASTHHGISCFHAGGHDRFNVCEPAGWVDGAGPFGTPVAAGFQ